MSQRPVRVGVVGAGWVATARHIPGFRSHPEAQVVALYDRSRDRARAVAERFRIPWFTSNLQALFEHGLDCVSICTPPWTHAELAIAALSGGMHVLTEKPMAMTLKEADAMAQAASGAGRMLCVSHNFLFSRAAHRAVRLLPKIGSIGYAVAIQLSSPARRLPSWYDRLPAGLFFDETPHMLYTLQRFIGRMETDGVRTFGRTADGHPANIEVHLRSDSCLAQLIVVCDAPLSEWHVGLVGQMGTLDLDLFRDICMFLGSDGRHGSWDILRTSTKALAGHSRGFVSSGIRYVSRRLLWGHDVLIRAFVDAILGRRPIPVPMDEALAVVGLTDQILGALGERP